MKLTSYATAALAAGILATVSAQALAGKFDSDALSQGIGKQLNLTSDKLSKLKPALDAKSDALVKSIDESVDKGFMELDAMSQKLEDASRQAEQQLREVLSSEELQQLDQYLENIDTQAIGEAQDRIVAELSGFLDLTAEQLSELKPVLENAFDQLNGLLNQMSKEGYRQLDEFKTRYQSLTGQLRTSVEGILNSGQLEKLDSHREELKEKIQAELFTG